MSEISTQFEALNLNELEPLARGKLTQSAYDYYSSGAADEITVRRNQAAFSEISLRPRMLVDISNLQTSVSLFGQLVSMPILVAPMAFQAMAHAQGELATARAAAAANTVMICSTLSNYSIEEIAAVANGNLWFQLYVYKGREITRSLVRRAEAAGYKALVVTVDSPLLGRRERDVRNRFQLPKELRIANFEGEETLGQFPLNVRESGLHAYIAELYDRALTWKDLEWMVSITKLPVLVKGILRGDDAVRAIECGARGIIVSNHGGRQLDTAIATIEALPEVVEAAGAKAEILMDGGVRRGTDVLKALALGAKAVLLGRPILWGLAIAGPQGPAHVLQMLRGEFELAMALSGCPTLQSISDDLLVRK
ncbi:MAG TPA: alpha-hydroxy acid oxidase [Planktothrix sp.]